MQRLDRSISMAQANLYGSLLCLPLLLLAVPFGLRFGWGALFAGLGAFFAPLSLILSLVAGIVVHELLHAAGWMLAGRRPWRDFSFGFQWKTLTPYCHARVPLPIGAYRVGAALPGLALGLLPMIVATIAGDGWLLGFGLLFTLAACGDMLILWLLRDAPTGSMVEDHPTRAGAYVLVP